MRPSAAPGVRKPLWTYGVGLNLVMKFVADHGLYT
jgi:hypothetical protein